jgi:hypothetical protein
MGLKPGDIIDEKKNHEQSCGIVTKVVSGGAGFEKMECCGFELDERDLADDWNQTIDRFEGGVIKKGTLIDEGKNHPDSCGLKMEVLAGGAGFKHIVCCGNVLSENDII